MLVYCTVHILYSPLNPELFYLQCLVTCGKGYKHRQTWCQFGEDRLDDRFCGSSKPESVQTCQQQECASWQVGPWGQVSVGNNFSMYYILFKVGNTRVLKVRGQIQGRTSLMCDANRTGKTAEVEVLDCMTVLYLCLIRNFILKHFFFFYKALKKLFQLESQPQHSYIIKKKFIQWMGSSTEADMYNYLCFSDEFLPDVNQGEDTDKLSSSFSTVPFSLAWLDKEHILPK